MAAATDGDTQALKTLKGLEVIYILLGLLFYTTLQFTVAQFFFKY